MVFFIKNIFSRIEFIFLYLLLILFALYFLFPQLFPFLEIKLRNNINNINNLNTKEEGFIGCNDAVDAGGNATLPDFLFPNKTINIAENVARPPIHPLTEPSIGPVFYSHSHDPK